MVEFLLASVHIISSIDSYHCMEIPFIISLSENTAPVAGSIAQGMERVLLPTKYFHDTCNSVLLNEK